MISQTAEYALRAVVALAQAGAPQTTQQLALTTRVPSGYLAKVLQMLGRAEIVNAQRGLHGGFTLRRSPDGLTVLDIVNAVDPVQRLRTCPLGLAAHGATLCPLHQRLDQAMASVEAALAASTIAELLAEDTRSTPLCDAPPKKARPETRSDAPVPAARLAQGPRPRPARPTKGAKPTQRPEKPGR